MNNLFLIRKFFFISFLLFSSCGIHKKVGQNVCNEYILNTDQYANEVFKICDDGSFYYSSNSENGIYYYCGGSWKRKGKYIILNTDTQLTFMPQMQMVYDSTVSDSVTIIVQNKFDDDQCLIIGLRRGLKSLSSIGANDYLLFDYVLNLSKAEYNGFAFNFELIGYKLNNRNSIGTSIQDKKLKKIIISNIFTGAFITSSNIIQKRFYNLKCKKLNNGLEVVGIGFFKISGMHSL